MSTKLFYICGSVDVKDRQVEVVRLAKQPLVNSLKDKLQTVHCCSPVNILQVLGHTSDEVLNDTYKEFVENEKAFYDNDSIVLADFVIREKPSKLPIVSSTPPCIAKENPQKDSKKVVSTATTDEKQLKEKSQCTGGDATSSVPKSTKSSAFTSLGNKSKKTTVKPAAKKGKGIGGFFTKATTHVAAPEPKASAAVEKQADIDSEGSAAEESPFEDDVEQPLAKKDEPKSKAKIKKAAAPSQNEKKRRRIITFSSDDDDDVSPPSKKLVAPDSSSAVDTNNSCATGRSNVFSTDDSVVMSDDKRQGSDSQPVNSSDVSLLPPPIQEEPKRRKRGKRHVVKRFMDSEGYMVTAKVLESFSESDNDDEEPSVEPGGPQISSASVEDADPPKKLTKKVPGQTGGSKKSAKATTGKGKQTSLTSFFFKK